MHLSDEQLIAEAIEINHAGIGKTATLERYQDHLVHFSHYLASAHAETFYSARRKHVRLFMSHLESRAASRRTPVAFAASGAEFGGYPNGRSGPGRSASYRKSYLSAIKFLYRHFQAEEDLPDHNPAALEASPRIVHKRGYAPSREEVKELLRGPGSPRGRLLANWMFYVPSRRKTFADARWRDIDLEAGTWEGLGKGEQVDSLPSPLPTPRAARVPALAANRGSAQPGDAGRAERSGDGLRATHPERQPDAPRERRQDPDRHAIRAGVGVHKAPGGHDAPGGLTSRVSPHAMRRAWATIALNDEEQPIDVVSEVLKHRDISTTRKHYAPTKSERARVALVEMRVA